MSWSIDRQRRRRRRRRGNDDGGRYRLFCPSVPKGGDPPFNVDCDELDATASSHTLQQSCSRRRPFRPPAYRKALYKALYVLLLGGTPFFACFEIPSTPVSVVSSHRESA